MEEKKSSGAVVVVAILCLLIGCAGGYFIATNLNNGSEVKENKEAVEKTVDTEEAKTLVYKYYKDGLINNINLDNEKWDQTYNIEENMLSVLLLHVSKNDWKEVDCSTVAKKGTGDFEGTYLLDDYSCSGEAVSYELMNKMYKELYGPGKELPKKSGEVNIIRKENVGSVPAYLAYNEANNIFVLGEVMGDENGPHENHYYSTIKNVKTEGNKLVVTLAYLALLDWDTVSNPSYQIGQERVKPDDAKIKGLTAEEIMKKYINQLDTFEFTFVKENGTYILESTK